MGLFDWLFGETAKPASTQATTDPVRLAADRDYNVNIVGEASYQDALDYLVGGKCEDGCELEVTAQIVFDEGNKYDRNAVAVLIRGSVVGYIPRQYAAEMRADILRVNPEQRPVICSAIIVGGWDRGSGDEGHYGVKLSLAEPMRVQR